MTEKVIYEVRVTETDDGYRIEVKGDKKHLRKMGVGHGMHCGPGMGFGPGRRHHGHHGRHHGHHPRRGRRGPGYGHGPGGDYDLGPWWDDDEPSPDEESPPADK